MSFTRPDLLHHWRRGLTQAAVYLAALDRLNPRAARSRRSGARCIGGIFGIDFDPSIGLTDAQRDARRLRPHRAVPTDRESIG